MRVILSLSIILAASILPTAVDALSSQNELVDRIKAGGHILMIRHAMAPGNGDPSNFRIGDCKTQRNLDDSGRAQAQKNWEMVAHQRGRVGPCLFQPVVPLPRDS